MGENGRLFLRKNEGGRYVIVENQEVLNRLAWLHTYIKRAKTCLIYISFLGLVMVYFHRQFPEFFLFFALISVCTYKVANVVLSFPI